MTVHLTATEVANVVLQAAVEVRTSSTGYYTGMLDGDVAKEAAREEIATAFESLAQAFTDMASDHALQEEGDNEAELRPVAEEAIAGD